MSAQFTRPGAAMPSGAVSDFASAAQDKISETVVEDQYDKLAGTIRRNPLQAAGIAAGIGFVLALLARR
jgi:ElaB/YqjD/DUF883 family membrane-anchored ribosome-binding protein